MATVKLGVDLDVRSGSKKLEADLKRISRVKLRLDDKGFRQPLGRITGDLSEFQKSLEASNARVVAFAASAGILYKLSQAFDFLVKSTINVEKQLQDINVVLGATDAKLKTFGNSLFQIAAQTGQSFKTVAESATEFSRQGLGMEKTLLRTRDAMVLARLSGMDVVESTNALTAAVNSFSSAALTSTQITAKLAAVDAAFAVSSEDLAKAIARVGSSAIDAGVDMDQLLAITTALQERTARGGAVIGNSLKTIFTRVQRPEVLNQLRMLNVEVRDVYGNTLPAMKVLQNLAGVFDNLSDSQRSTTSELVGGVFQVNQLKAALADLRSQYSKYNEAVKISASATNEANLRNEELNKTLSAQLNKLSQQATQVAASGGEMLIRPTVERGIELSQLVFGDLDKGESGVFGKAGEDIGKALMAGIGKFIAGPGLGIGALIVGKLLKDFFVFSTKALGDLVRMSGKTTEIKNTEAQLRSILSQNLDIVKQISAGTISRAQAEKEIVSQMQVQNVLQREIMASSLGMAPGVTAAKRSLPRRASGHIPSFSHGFVPAGAAAGEIAGAYASGYTPGQIRSTNISGVGKVVYNSREKVKKFPGFSQPAIIPPAGSKAGVKYGKEFKKIHGFTPFPSGAIPAGYSGASALGAFGVPTIRDLTTSSGRRRDPLTGRFMPADIQVGKMSSTGRFSSGAADAGVRDKVRMAYERMLKHAEQNGRSIERENKIRNALQKKFKISDASMQKLNKAYEFEARDAEMRRRTRIAEESNLIARDNARQADDLAAADRKARRTDMLKMGATVLAPVILEGINQGFKRDQITSGADAAFNERLGAGTTAVGNISSYAIMGSMAGPYGALAGGLIGGAMSLPAIMEAFGSESTRLATDLSIVTEKFQELATASAALEKGIANVEQVFSGRMSEQQGARVLSEFAGSMTGLTGLDADLRKNLNETIMSYINASAAGDMEKKAEIRKGLFGDGDSIGVMGEARQAALLAQTTASQITKINEFREKDYGRFDNPEERKMRVADAKAHIQNLMQSPSRTPGKTVQDMIMEEGVTDISALNGEQLFNLFSRTLHPSILNEFSQHVGNKASHSTNLLSSGLPGFPSQLVEGEDGSQRMDFVNLEVIREGIDDYQKNFFGMFVTMRKFLDDFNEETRLTTDEFEKEMVGVLDDYKESMREFSRGIARFRGAVSINESNRALRAQGAIGLASEVSDPRSVARMQFQSAQQATAAKTQASLLGVMEKMFKTGAIGDSVVNALRPFVDGTKDIATLVPGGDAQKQKDVLDSFRSLVNLAPARNLGAQSWTGSLFSNLGVDPFFNATANPSMMGPNYRQMGVGSEKAIYRDFDPRTDAGNVPSATDVATALQYMGQSEIGRKLLADAGVTEDKQSLIFNDLIKITAENIKSTDKNTIELENNVKAIQQRNEIAFGGGLQSLMSGPSAASRSSSFLIREGGRMFRNGNNRQRGQAAMKNLEEFASIARVMPESFMSREVLNRVGRQTVIDSQAKELDTLTRNMGLTFSASDLKNIASKQVDAALKPSDSTLLVEEAKSTATTLKRIEQEGINIKNVQHLGKVIAAVINGDDPSTVPNPPAGSSSAGGGSSAPSGGRGRGVTPPDVSIRPEVGNTPDRFPHLRAAGEGFFFGGGSIDSQLNNFGGLMTELGDDLRTGFKGALKEAIFEAESFSDALRSMTVSVLDTLADKIFSMAIDSMFNAVGTKVMGNKGGYVTNSGIQRFARGGMVQGGSGFRDDVPAMLSRGEFVVRKSAVDKYGSGFLNALNMAGGGAVISASNRIIANHPRRPTDFKYNFSPNLSSLAITDESRKDVASRRKLADKIFRNRAQYQREMHAYKQQQRGRLIQGYMSAAMTMGSYAMNYGFNNPTIDPQTGMMMGTNLPATGGPMANPSSNMVNRGGFISKFANGGYVDDVPALLMGGEMVMNRDAVNKHGRGFFEKLNRGSLEGMAEGGMVGGFSTGSSSGSGDSVVQLFDRLISSNESLASVIEESNKTGGATGTGSSANNNVTINVNIDKSGVKSDSKTSSEDNSSNASGGMKADEEKAARMGEEIRMACLDVIINEKRPGGALSDFGVGGR